MDVVDAATQGLTIERVPVDSLVIDPRNARKGNVAAIVASLQEFGQHRPAVVRRETMQVIVGNHMVKAAQTLGWREIDVVFVDDDEETAIRRSLADNATGDLAGWDEELLATLVREVGAVPGFDDKAVEGLLKKLAPPPPAIEPTYPIVARPNEQYDYVLIVAQNATDVAYLETKLQLRTERSYKSNAVGKSHVVSVERLQELWGS